MNKKGISKKFLLVGLLWVAVIFIGPGWAAIDTAIPAESYGASVTEVVTTAPKSYQMINLQGKLTATGGAAVSGTQSLTFKIWDHLTGDTPAALWTENQTSVRVDANGIFNVYLGSSNAITFIFDPLKNYYLGITVGTGTEMTPRQQLVAVPLANSAYMTKYLKGGRVEAVSGISTYPAIKATVEGTAKYGVYSTGSTVGGGVVGKTINAPTLTDADFGVAGLSKTGSGVYGLSQTSGDAARWKAGVYGASDGGKGVMGWSSSGEGVYGESTSGHGVEGISTNAVGVYGKGATAGGSFESSAAGSSAVRGVATGSTGVGVYGMGATAGGSFESATGIGVYGSSIAAGNADYPFKVKIYRKQNVPSGSEQIFDSGLGRGKEIYAIFASYVSVSEVSGGEYRWRPADDANIHVYYLSTDGTFRLRNMQSYPVHTNIVVIYP
jgi:hypothetical protein